MTLGNPDIDRCYEKMNSISFSEHIHTGVTFLIEKVGTKTRTLLLATAMTLTPTANAAQETTTITTDIGISSVETVSFDTPPDYRVLLWESFDREVLKLPDNIDIIFSQYVTPLRQVLIDKWLGEFFMGEDIANIVTLAMLQEQWSPDFQQQYDYVAASFPNPEVDADFRAKIRELFKIGEK